MKNLYLPIALALVVALQGCSPAKREAPPQQGPNAEQGQPAPGQHGPGQGVPPGEAGAGQGHNPPPPPPQGQGHNPPPPQGQGQGPAHQQPQDYDQSQQPAAEGQDQSSYFRPGPQHNNRGYFQGGHELSYQQGGYLPQGHYGPQQVQPGHFQPAPQGHPQPLADTEYHYPAGPQGQPYPQPLPQQAAALPYPQPQPLPQQAAVLPYPQPGAAQPFPPQPRHPEHGQAPHQGGFHGPQALAASSHPRPGRNVPHVRQFCRGYHDHFDYWGDVDFIWGPHRR